MQQQKKAYFLALLSIGFWCTMGTAFKLTLGYVNPPLLLLMVTAVAFTVLFLTVIFTGRLQLIRKLKFRDLAASALMGLFNPFLYYMVLFKAYSIIPAQEAVTLNYLWPVMLVVFSMIFLRQKITLVSFVAILVSFFGTIIIATHGNPSSFRFENPLGVSLAAGSSIFWASFWILNMKDKRDDISKMMMNFLFGLVYITAWNLATANFSVPPIKGVIGSVYIGIFEMGLTFVLWLTALKLSSNTARVSNLVFISPFLSLLLVSLFVGEKILVSTVIGLIFIVGGILLQAYSGKTNKNADLTN
jgi:drug/metabolite transporter (DMT)-like permease